MSATTSGNWKPFKMVKNAFYFASKALFVIAISKHSFWLFGHVGKRFDKKAKESFKIHDVTTWETNNYNTDIARYLKK